MPVFNPPDNLWMMGQQLLYLLRGANMAITTDQIFTSVYQGVVCVPSLQNIVLVCKTGAFNTQCVGGAYAGTNKTGMVLISAATNWAGLTGPGTSVHPVAGVLTSTMTSPPYLSLTIGNSGPLTADVFIYGAIVD
jgi:hypothetical protein